MNYTMIYFKYLNNVKPKQCYTNYLVLLQILYIFLLILYRLNLVFQIFGPVQQIIKFKTLDEVIKRANETKYGLAAGVLTNDINIALKYMENVDAGSVW